VTTEPESPIDPVRARRRQVAQWVGRAKRIGYLGLLAAIVAFAIGYPTGFPGWTVTLAVAGFAVSCITLPAAVAFGYGVNAAEREDRARSL
jgi:hypothetical protein